MRKKTGLTLLSLLLATLVALNVVSAQEEETELRIDNPNPPLGGGSTVYYTFEIIDPDRTAVPSETIYFKMRVTNLPTSTSALTLSYGWGGWWLPPEHGDFYFDIEWPTVPIGGTYEGPFGHFVFTNAVPVGSVFTGAMGIGVYDGDPPFISDTFSVTFVAPPPVVNSELTVSTTTVPWYRVATGGDQALVQVVLIEPDWDELADLADRILDVKVKDEFGAVKPGEITTMTVTHVRDGRMEGYLTSYTGILLPAHPMSDTITAGQEEITNLNLISDRYDTIEISYYDASGLATIKASFEVNHKTPVLEAGRTEYPP